MRFIRGQIDELKGIVFEIIKFKLSARLVETAAWGGSELIFLS